MQVIADLRHGLHGEPLRDRIEIHQAGMRLDLGMIDLGAADRLLAHQVGLGKTFLPVAEVVMHFAFEIAGLVVVQQRRAGGARVFRGVIGRQLAQLEVDEGDRALGGLRIHGGDRRKRFAAVAHALARHRIFIHRDRKHAVGERAILAGDHREHAVERARLGDVEAQDFAVAHRAAQDAADEGAGVIEIGGVERAAGDLLDAIDQRHTVARNLCVRASCSGHDTVSTAALTDSMIFT